MKLVSVKIFLTQTYFLYGMTESNGLKTTRQYIITLSSSTDNSCRTSIAKQTNTEFRQDEKNMF